MLQAILCFAKLSCRTTWLLSQEVWQEYMQTAGQQTSTSTNKMISFSWLKVTNVGVHLLPPTSAVLGGDGVAIETRGTLLTVGTSRVSPTVLAVARRIMALIENQVGVRVAVTVTPLTGIANCHWVAIVSWSTPEWGRLWMTGTIKSLRTKDALFSCLLQCLYFMLHWSAVCSSK